MLCIGYFKRPSEGLYKPMISWAKVAFTYIQTLGQLRCLDSFIALYVCIQAGEKPFLLHLILSIVHYPRSSWILTVLL